MGVEADGKERGLGDCCRPSVTWVKLSHSAISHMLSLWLQESGVVVEVEAKESCFQLVKESHCATGLICTSRLSVNSWNPGLLLSWASWTWGSFSLPHIPHHIGANQLWIAVRTNLFITWLSQVFDIVKTNKKS
jgi:hypothetical protein